MAASFRAATKSSAAAAQQQRAAPVVFDERDRAPIVLRCGAILIDYILIVGGLALSTIFAKVLGGAARTAGLTVEAIGVLISLAVAAINLIVFPAWRGQTVGKWATGLRIESRKQSAANPRRLPGLGRVVLRHVIGYPLSMIVGGLGYVMAFFSVRGLALHDRLSRTIVVRYDRRRHHAVSPRRRRQPPHDEQRHRPTNA